MSQKLEESKKDATHRKSSGEFKHEEGLEAKERTNSI
jgi:hypothetical protein